ncbi:DNA translocase FtsK [Loigolactobacillus zhaoyuanensis]|uniref:DNA translocase FtsK n=1 Tax=Loigolactobacillus zhaoyuanensis TaxID=2486017 RepID=UPI0013DDE23B|nr:DNA translocase FtsK [Loigolactobacillus zhaoyuanensis]
MDHYDGPVFLRRQPTLSAAKQPQRHQHVATPTAAAAVATPVKRTPQPTSQPIVTSNHRFTPKYIPQSRQRQQTTDEQIRLNRYVQALNKSATSYLLFDSEPAIAVTPTADIVPTFLPATANDDAETETIAPDSAETESTAPATATVAAESESMADATATPSAQLDEPVTSAAQHVNPVATAETDVVAVAESAVPTPVSEPAASTTTTETAVAAELEPQSEADLTAASQAAADSGDTTVDADKATMTDSELPEATSVTVPETEQTVAEANAAAAVADPDVADATATPSWQQVVAAVTANTPVSQPVPPVDSKLPNNESVLTPQPIVAVASQSAPTLHQTANTVGDSHDAKPQLTIKEQAPLDDQHYQLPPFSLLPEPVKDNSSEMKAWVEQQRTVLNETLKAFNVQATVSRWSIGPAVTQFEVSLARGVKVSKITNLSDDLKLALAAKDIRIEAPIPGKSTVGIEIPNLKSRPVMLSEVVESTQFQESKSPLTVALGVDLFGQPMVTNVGKMPHGLIAGATGSGKSVFINSLLLSILFKAKPSEVKLLLIDPKAVELAPYNGLPHLLSPVISDPKAAAAALKWAVDEMENRYQKMAAAGVRNLEQFNTKAAAHGDHGLKMPYIVIIIDELADLMMVASNEVQDYIVRITQKARAAGIHLLVATQRPSVDVITGTIKNNIPTRLAFMVSSQIDSRTIIDQGGAERLLGRGDMLYLGNGQSQPIRIQGTYAESEIDPIVDFVKQQLPPHYLFEPEGLLEKVEATENQDEIFPEVLTYIADEAQVSTSKLQRVFSIGYNRAANLIDSLEQRNLISPASGSKPRDVYFTPEDLIQYQESKQMN